MKRITGLVALLLIAGSSRAQIPLRSLPTGTLTYPTADIVDFREGTIECWVRFDFDPRAALPAKTYTGLLTLLLVGGEFGGANFHFAAQAGATNASWFCSVSPQPRLHGCYIATPTSDLFGKWQHLAFVWQGREMRIYRDGELACRVEHNDPPALLWGRVGAKPLFFGDQWNQHALMTIDDLRVSRVAREPGELGWTAGAHQPDPYTTLLDRFEEQFTPDGQLTTRPAVMFGGAGGLPSAHCRFVPGKFGTGLAFYHPGEETK